MYVYVISIKAVFLNFDIKRICILTYLLAVSFFDPLYLNFFIKFEITRANLPRAFKISSR